MIISPQLATVFAGALVVLIGACLTFGHRYSDRCGKLRENSSELNEIKFSMRSETTVPAIDSLWRYLLETDGALREAEIMKGPLDLKSGNVLDTKSLLFDVNRRDRFNMFINDVEKAFKECVNIDVSWSGLASCYAQIGQALYVLAAIIGLGGYGLLLLTMYPLLSLTVDQIDLFIGAVLFSAIMTVAVIILRHLKARSNRLSYEGGKMKYLVEVTRVPK